MDALTQAGIDQNICFKYDDIYFPYIVLWYSTMDHKTHYQVFIDRATSQMFYDTLARRGKQPVYYHWHTKQLQYKETI